MPERKPTTPLANESRQWLASAALSAAVLEPLHELNRRWLALLVRMPRLWPAKTASARLPDLVGANLLALTPERCMDIARCPFSLFSASFNDGAYWRDLAGNIAVHESPAAEQVTPARDALTGFAELALFYAWHLARVNPAAARIVLGMTDQTLAAFEVLTLTALQDLALSGKGLLAPRWPDRPAFWLQLLESPPYTALPTDVRLLGLQMMAAELNAPPPRVGAAPNPGRTGVR